MHFRGHGRRAVRILAMCVIQIAAAGCLVAQTSAGSIGKMAPEAAGFSRERLARITEYFNNEVATRKIPGALVLIQRRGGAITAFVQRQTKR